MGDRLWQGGTTYGATDGPSGTIYSAMDGPGGLFVVAVHGPGGPLIGGTIHSMTVSQYVKIEISLAILK